MQNLRETGNTKGLHERRAALIERVEATADEVFEKSAGRRSREDLLSSVQRFHDAGFTTAALPQALGGLGLGVEAGGHLPQLRCLAAAGGADLALGRVLEGHVNALILLHAYGTPAQLARAAEAAHAGMLFGVWNTGDVTPMRMEPRGDEWILQGCKTFATGASFVDRPVVTAERGGWQMTLPRMEAPQVAAKVRIDHDAWHPFGMEASESHTIDFTHVRLAEADLIGGPGDFYRDPLFRGGAIRFAAVQAGAVLRLARSFADWVTERGRQSDPHQLARLGELELLAQEVTLWIERAASVAEICLWPTVTDGKTQRRMVHFANMTRLAIERAGTAAMSRIVPGVGAHGLLRPARFERILRDLTMYLRQPNPDGVLADVARTALLDEPPLYWTDISTEPVLGE